MNIFLKILIALAAVVVLLRACGPAGVDDHPLIGKPAPDVTLTALSGEEVSLSWARNDQPAVVFFWATWCPHCRTQLKELSERKEELEQKGIKVVAVDIGEDARTVSTFCKRNKVLYGIFLDRDGSAADAYGVFGVPMFFSFDVDGVVVGVGLSFAAVDEKRLLGDGLGFSRGP